MSSYTSSSDVRAADRAAPVLLWGLAFALMLVPMITLEAWVRSQLFAYASYSNSRSLDASWKALKARQDWTVLYLGDSEVRWGVDPDAADAELSRAGLSARGFNMGIDGFSGALSSMFLKHMSLPSQLPNLRVAVIGTQLIEAHPTTPVKGPGDFGCDGALQAPIFASPMARDLGFDRLCQSPHWSNHITRTVEDVSAVVRYRQSIRSMLVGWSEAKPGVIAFNSGALQHRSNGFQPNKPITEDRRNHEQALAARRADIAANTRMRAPLDAEIWPALTQVGGYFDGWASALLQEGVLPVFLALPTNPLLIDLQQRRADYLRNSKLLRQWQQRRGDVVFIDLGIKDAYVPDLDYSDFRHLSIQGAEKFSRELGRSLAKESLVVNALKRPTS